MLQGAARRGKERLMLVVASRRATRSRYGESAPLLDVTSRGPEPWVRFSPFYPHGGIPVPFSPGVFSHTVEGIWQGLKVFATADVDPSKFEVTTMRGLKRSARQYGSVLGHRAGVTGGQLLPYAEARQAIYLPSYHWVLAHRLRALLDDLRQMARAQTVVLLDYETNGDVRDVSRPLSHAWLVKHYLDGTWPG
jgi:hypothetical protein